MTPGKRNRDISSVFGNTKTAISGSDRDSRPPRATGCTNVVQAGQSNPFAFGVRASSVSK